MLNLLQTQDDALQVFPSLIEITLTSGLRIPLGLVSPVGELNIDSERHTFLHFHIVKEMVTFCSRGHGHDVVRHESAS